METKVQSNNQIYRVKVSTKMTPYVHNPKVRDEGSCKPTAHTIFTLLHYSSPIININTNFLASIHTHIYIHFFFLLNKILGHV